MTISDWVKDLMVNSSEAELKQRVDKKFENLESLARWDHLPKLHVG